MQVEDKVPVTRVTRVSDMRSLHKIDDNAMILVVQDGVGWKTTFATLKSEILNDADSKSKRMIDQTVGKQIAKLTEDVQATKQLADQLSTNVQTAIGDTTFNKIKQESETYSRNVAAKAVQELFSNISADSAEIHSKLEAIDNFNLSQLKIDVEDLASKIESTQSEITELKNDSKNKEIDIVNNSTVLADIKKAVEDSSKFATDNINSLKSELSILSVESATMNKTMSSEFKKHTNGKKSAEKKIDSLSAEYIDRIAKVDYNINEVKSSISSAKLQLAKELAETITQDLSAIAANAASEKIDEFDKKLFGVEVVEVSKDDDGNMESTTNIIQPGLLHEIQSQLSSLQEAIEDLRKNQ